MKLTGKGPNGKVYEAVFEGFSFKLTDTIGTTINVSSLTLTEDGVEKESYGENFAGQDYDSIYTFRALVRAFINSEYGFEWINIPEELLKIKYSFSLPALLIGDTFVPQKYLCANGNIAELKIVTDGFSEAYKAENPDYDKDFKGIASYASKDGDLILVDLDGRVITDIDCFWESAMACLDREQNCVYGQEELAKAISYING